MGYIDDRYAWPYVRIAEKPRKEVCTFTIAKTGMVPDTCSLYSVGTDATPRMKRRYCLTLCGICLVIDGIISHCRKRGGKVMTIHYTCSYFSIVMECF